MDPFIYYLPVALSYKRLLKKIPKSPAYKISFERGEKKEGVLLDTFNGVMFHSARMLFQVGEMLLLVDLQSGQMTEQVSTGDWSLAADLEDGPVSSLLKSASKLRAFLPVAKVELCKINGLLLDDEGKTRVRFRHLDIRCGKNTAGVGSTQYLRGYGQAHQHLRKLLEKIGGISCQDVGQVCEALAIDQEQFTVKPEIQLNPEAAVCDTGKAIIRAFIQTARRNEDGVVADYDTEFLHDYRVSLRKVRSVLSLFKGVFSLEETILLKQDLASIMQKTNTLRDLDVYLLNKEQYLALVPLDTHEGLGLLFDYFAEERKKEQKSVSKFFRSKIYPKDMVRIEKLFRDGSALSAGPRGIEKSKEFACSLIVNRYHKVCKIARSIDRDTEDRVVHQLRINCKKLRYLMEFFAPLFPENEIVTLIKALKLLQDNLGRFNDYSVQQKFLRQVLNNKIDRFGGLEVKVADAVGALTAMLNRLQRKERRQVMKNFDRFDSSETRLLLSKLFHAEAV